MAVSDSERHTDHCAVNTAINGAIKTHIDSHHRSLGSHSGPHRDAHSTHVAAQCNTYIAKHFTFRVTNDQPFMRANCASKSVSQCGPIRRAD